MPRSHTHLFDGLVGDQVVTVIIPREDIEQGFIAPALASLQRLIATRDALEASNGTISLLIGGYDDDSRDVHLVPEIRAYFHALDAQFPYWFHVCTRIEHSLRLLFTLLVDLTPVTLEAPPGAIGYRFSHDDLNAFVAKRLDAMQRLHVTHGFDPEKSQRIRELTINYFALLANL